MNRKRRFIEVTEFLSSSDSSDDEVELAILEMVKRPRLAKAKINNYVRDVVSQYTEEQYSSKSTLELNEKLSISLLECSKGVAIFPVEVEEEDL